MTEAIRKAFAIPDVFSPKNGGFGSIQSSAGNCSLLCAHVAKSKCLLRHKDDPKAKEKLVCYFSEVSHGHAVRASMMSGYAYYRESKAAWDESAQNFVFDLVTLKKTIEEDINNGLIPCFIISVVGSTATGGMDDIPALAELSKKHDISLFVDGAWGGNYTVHEDYRYFLKGVEEADFYQFNPSKLLGVGMNTSLVWMRSKEDAAQSFQVPNHDTTPTTSFKLGDTVKSSIIKMHLFLQTYGIDKLKQTVKVSVENAIFFEELIKTDDRFEIYPKTSLSLVKFRLKKDNENVSRQEHEALNKRLVERISEWDGILIGGGMAGGEYFLRLSIWAGCTKNNMIESFKKIVEAANHILA